MFGLSFGIFLHGKFMDSTKWDSRKASLLNVLQIPVRCCAYHIQHIAYSKATAGTREGIGGAIETFCAYQKRILLSTFRVHVAEKLNP